MKGFEAEDEFGPEVERQAAEWTARLDRGLGRRERRAYEEWLASEPEHKRAMESFGASRESLRRLRELLPPDAEEQDADVFAPGEADGARRRGRWAWVGMWGGLAACLAVAFLLWPDAERGEEEAGQALTARAEVLERIFLPDGTLIELKPGAEVEARWTPWERRVEVLRGEAHFSVARDVERPFVVYAGDAAFQALGTAFNVRLSDGDVELLVTEGVVGVGERAERRGAVKSREGLPRLQGRVEALQRTVISFARVDRVEPRIEPVSPRMVEELLAWKHETLDFDGTPLAEAVRAFNLRNRDQIELADPELGDRLIDGSFRSDNLDGFVFLLEAAGNLWIDRSQSGRIVFHEER